MERGGLDQPKIRRRGRLRFVDCHDLKDLLGSRLGRVPDSIFVPARPGDRFQWEDGDYLFPFLAARASWIPTQAAPKAVNAAGMATMSTSLIAKTQALTTKMADVTNQNRGENTVVTV